MEHLLTVAVPGRTYRAIQGHDPAALYQTPQRSKRPGASDDTAGAITRQRTYAADFY
ncbi:MAG TPA: hypothetical protein VMV40_06315 [Acidiferrobacter sp.]|nr:hypothetical protein [Acidiferrobacter sp.]